MAALRDDGGGPSAAYASMTTGGRKDGRLLPLGQPRYDERFRDIQCVCFDADEVGARCFHESGGAPRAQSRAENH